MSLLDDIRAELEEHEEARAILEEIWAWYGPYGPSAVNNLPTRDIKTKSGQRAARQVFLAMQMPRELQIKIQKYFKFDDSE